MTIKNVTVLKGGWSAERDVSLSSGRECAKALREAGYEVHEVDVTRDLRKLAELLYPLPDVFFNALHGRGGEDGCIQGVLDLLDVPYTHSGRMASSVAMDKQRSKNLLKQRGVKSPEGVILTRKQIVDGEVPFDAPYVIKPNNEGSSVGVHIIRPGDNRDPLSDNNWAFDDEILVEEYIPGRELTVAVMSSKNQPTRAMTVTEINPTVSFYDYEAKYAEGGSEHVLPAPVDGAVFDAALRAAECAHDALGCTGVTRTDFRYDDTQPGADGLYYLETNTQPGMTPTSLVPEQAAHNGMSFEDLVSWMVENAQCHL